MAFPYSPPIEADYAGYGLIEASDIITFVKTNVYEHLYPIYSMVLRWHGGSFEESIETTVESRTKFNF